ncbi:MAG: VOC family protein [Candidatus Izemoplasmataceae bacterium]
MKDVIHFYRVEDLDNVKKFYGELLGFKLYKDQKNCLIYDVKFGKLGFCTHHPKEKKQDACITFVYGSQKEVDRLYHKLARKLIVTDEPTINQDYDIYHFFVRDYEGLTVEFQAFL